MRRQLRRRPKRRYDEIVDLEHLVAIITGEFRRPVAFQPVGADGAHAASSLASPPHREKESGEKVKARPASFLLVTRARRARCEQGG